MSFGPTFSRPAPTAHIAGTSIQGSIGSLRSGNWSTSAPIRGSSPSSSRSSSCSFRGPCSPNCSACRISCAASAPAPGRPGTFALLGVAALAVAVGASWYAYSKSTEKVDIESIDLSKGDTPRSAHVVITGIARTDYILEFERKIAGTTTLDRYIPLTAAAWRRGEPRVYFMKTNATVYLPSGGGRMFEFSRGTPPFQM